MKTIRIYIAAVLCAWAALAQGVVNGDRVFIGKLDASGATLTAPLRVLSSEPATCDNTKHEIYYSTALSKARICNALNTWSDFTGSLTIPPPGPSSLGGVDSKDCSALGTNYFLQKVNTDGSITCSPTAIGGAIHTVTFSATPTFACTSTVSDTFTITLTGNVTSSTLSGCSTGEAVRFDVCQDATGARTYVWPTNVIGPPAIDSTASACTFQTFVYDGTNANPSSPAGTSGPNPGLYLPAPSGGGSVTLQSATGSSNVTITVPQTSGTAGLTIASGSTALGTTAIASGACATVVTVTATGVLTTDTISADFNTDPTALTGYGVSTAGVLNIYKYPTAGAVNFRVCNSTGASITPAAATLNWRVAR